MKRHICYNCKHEFLSEKLLIKHMDNKYPCIKKGTNQLVCQNCKKEFANKYTLKKHLECEFLLPQKIKGRWYLNKNAIDIFDFTKLPIFIKNTCCGRNIKKEFLLYDSLTIENI